MRICLVAEGSYPYITGGVSSWIQMLITNMPEHEFIIYCIGALEESRNKFSYKLPPNVISVEEVFLDSILKKQGTFGKKYSLSQIEKNNIENLITGNEVNFFELFKLLRNKGIKNISDFFMSKDFFTVVMTAYEKKYAMVPFTEFFWSMRSMLMPLFYIINQDVPKADLYHSVSTGYSGIVASLASTLYNKPYILTEHGIYTREREEEIIKSKWIKSYFKDMWIQFFYSLSICSYNSATEVITLFNKNKTIEIELGCDAKKIKIIPNGINVNTYKDVITKHSSENIISVGAVLRVVPIKDIKTMIESFAIVSGEIKNCKFYIIGPTDEDDEYYEECLKLVDSLKLENVIFTGKTDIKKYMKIIDIMVLSSISEGQPLAILEGMACRKPFVTTDVGSCSELIYGVNDKYGPAGIVVPIMNYIKMGKAIIKLCKDENLRKQMGENGYKRVSQFYTLGNFINGYKYIYRRYEGKK